MFMLYHRDVVRLGKIFYNCLLSNIIVAPTEELSIVAGDLNGHAGKDNDGFEKLHLENG